MSEPVAPRDQLADMRTFRIHIGHRVRDARVFRQMRQDELAAALGVSLEQIQKYEMGARSVSASRLWQISRLLALPVASFFEGLPDDVGNVYELGADTPPPMSDVSRRVALLIDQLGDESIGTRLHELLSHLASARQAKSSS